MSDHTFDSTNFFSGVELPTSPLVRTLVKIRVD
ncbi:hypothetical protein NP493_383g01026 [Ridgeia piscesae]|uniref:Uncharacterized protein n=1 Tax=Ridgeia piscesae TaxID=27915 RepID=A0AAD9NV16_RIDPI|nr:hypothetical protein NP493_383g01026 [Ridgeia piscesae]